MLETLNLWLASGLGLGYAPVAPGTVGSLLGVAFAWALLARPLGQQVGAVLVLLGIGGGVCHYAGLYHGGLDHGSIVLDEIVAFPLAVLGLKAARTLWGMALAFGVYRFFDAFKPAPVHLAEYAPGGLGVVLDDVIAALLTWLILAAVLTLYRRRGARANA
ncbi:phosphatidylglycerophosphatase A family protein [Vreelandella sp. TE19]